MNRSDDVELLGVFFATCRLTACLVAKIIAIYLFLFSSLPRKKCLAVFFLIHIEPVYIHKFDAFTIFIFG